MAKRRGLVMPRMGSPGNIAIPMQTALSQVDPTEESTTPTTYDLYITHPAIDTVAFKARKKSTAVAIIYGATSIVLEAASDWYVDLDAAIVTALGGGATGESAAFFHVGDPTSAANRIEYAAGQSWLAKPSAVLGAAVAAYHVATMPDFFNGVFADECQADIPNDYWTLMKTDDNLNLTDASRPAYNHLWRQNISAFLYGMKAVWQEERIVIANSAGAVYPPVDGIAIEAAHIVTNGAAWAKQQFSVQHRYFEANPYRFRRVGKSGLNISFDYPMGMPGIVLDGHIE